MHDYDRKYLRSKWGLSKLACLFCYIVGSLCVLCSSVHLSNFRGSSYLVISVAAFMATLTLLLFQYLRLWQSKFPHANIARLSLYVHATLTVAYFIVSGLVLSLDIASYTTAAFFGLTAFTINGLETYDCYRRSRLRDMATQTI
ncbi:uncharacterized protein LOC115629818 [Scaptodrosophila lebanonensis]|uniref:Uncharacterized protein LOC115629818 n=1 Tax=Drosophila lebanonensis TaxID=7225 RepID=A0A6J2U1L1_DROLE|nr:uncharacterized protein LOC115629818 [Scaptodrosophila lebanonensis]